MVALRILLRGLQWQGNATDEESEAAIKMGAEFAKRFPQFERSLSNAKAMCRYMQEHDLPGTELSSYIAAFRALSEKGELTLVKTETADEFYANHPELHPTGVPPLVQVREAKAANTAAHFEQVASASAQAGSTTEVDRASLDSAVSASGWDSQSYEVQPDRVVFYVWPRAGGTTFSFTFKPRFAMTAQSSESILYDYYNPEARASVPPARFNVEGSALPNEVKNTSVHSEKAQRRLEVAFTKM